MSNYEEKSELKLEFLSILGFNPFPGNDSSSRQQMVGSHLSQRLITEGCSERRIQTGLEYEIGKYTFNVRMPCNGKILRIIERYPRNLGQDTMAFSPESIVIYEDTDTREIGYFNVPYYMSFHQYHGYKLKPQPERSMLMPGNFIEKGTVFYDSHAKKENGGYAYGNEVNIVSMSHPAVSEDGIVISDAILDKFKFNVFETRVIEFGSKTFPLNLYGTKDNYKPLPEIGESIRSDGVVMATREYKPELAPVEMSIYDTMELDYVFDNPIFARGPEGRVVDIKVYHNDNEFIPTPKKTTKTLDKYARALRKFYQDILDAYKEIANDQRIRYQRKTPMLKPSFHRLIIEAMSVIGLKDRKGNEEIEKQYRRSTLDDYRVEIVIEYTLKPNIGYKLTGLHGDKGTICKIEKAENMPVDAFGKRADIIMDDLSTTRRQNPGRFYEMYLCDAAWHHWRKMRLAFGLEMGVTYKRIELENLVKNNIKLMHDAYKDIVEFFDIVSPIQAKKYKTYSNENIFELVVDVLEVGHYIYFPPDNPKSAFEVAKELKEKKMVPKSTITYVDGSGNRVTTKQPVRITPYYMLLLEKIADSWSSVSSANLQHFGVLSPINRSEKYSYPWKNSPAKTLGETEGRLVAAYCAEEAIAEHMDRNNSPITHREVVKSIMNATSPTNINNAVDRDKIPYGAAKPLQIVSHQLACYGIEYVYEPEDTSDE